ncbi:MAG: N-acetyltransferase [Clostridiales bacterium]|nr:N-acetyltransferase [Clostridiales bacterium]
MIEIRQATTAKDRRNFVNFFFDLYKGNKYWAPPFRDNERNLMIEEKNYASEYCDTAWFLAYKDNKIVGRVGAIVNNRANDVWNNKVVRITRFDFIDDKEVSKALINAVTEFGKSLGMTEIQGPIGFTDLDYEGMLIEGFEEQSTLVTLYNYEYYVDHMDSLGFKKDADWVEYQVKVTEKATSLLSRISEIVLKRSEYKLLEFTKINDAKKHLDGMFDVWTDAYKELYGTTPLSQKQIDQAIKENITFANPHFLKLIADKNDKIVGFGLCFPSFTKAARIANGNLLPFGIFHFLRARNKIEVLDLYLVGVIPELQGLGLNAIIMDAVMKSGKKFDIKFAETNPELETNTKVRSQWKYFEKRQHRRRRCYIRSID